MSENCVVSKKTRSSLPQLAPFPTTPSTSLPGVLLPYIERNNSLKFKGVPKGPRKDSNKPTFVVMSFAFVHTSAVPFGECGAIVLNF